MSVAFGQHRVAVGVMQPTPLGQGVGVAARMQPPGEEVVQAEVPAGQYGGVRPIAPQIATGLPRQVNELESRPIIVTPAVSGQQACPTPVLTSVGAGAADRHRLARAVGGRAVATRRAGEPGGAAGPVGAGEEARRSRGAHRGRPGLHAACRGAARPGRAAGAVRAGDRRGARARGRAARRGGAAARRIAAASRGTTAGGGRVVEEPEPEGVGAERQMRRGEVLRDLRCAERARHHAQFVELPGGRRAVLGQRAHQQARASRRDEAPRGAAPFQDAVGIERGGGSLVDDDDEVPLVVAQRGAQGHLAAAKADGVDSLEHEPVPVVPGTERHVTGVAGEADQPPSEWSSGPTPRFE